MRLAVINCEHFDRAGGTCPIVTPYTAATCETCAKRVPIIFPYQFVHATIEAEGEVEQAAPTEYLLCIERLREEWGEAWQKNLKAAAVRRTARGYFVPIAVYEEALKNRKK